MKVDVVIGANFGDEGKGLVTNFLAGNNQSSRPLVVRFNGGAQAGHTVDHNGIRHVFHHFGSGTLQGVPTYLSEFFIVNPVLYFQEREELIAKKVGIPSVVYVDKKAQITTPYDVAINQIVENRRADGRHGSCGVGINETVTRSANKQFGLTVGDVADQPRSAIVHKLVGQIGDKYVPQRLRQLGIDPFDLTQQEMDMLYGSESTDAFIHIMYEFVDSVVDIGGSARAELLSRPTLHDHLIFEGAQGLLLDEHHRYFPYVTRSRTGLPNVATLARQHMLPELSVYYVSRTYLTRHGAGPLPFEMSREQLQLTHIDQTNVPNDFQGTLRYAPFHHRLFSDSISTDLANFPVRNVNVVFTHTNEVQHTDGWKFINGRGQSTSASFDFVINEIAQRDLINNVFVSDNVSTIEQYRKG